MPFTVPRIGMGKPSDPDNRQADPRNNQENARLREPSISGSINRRPSKPTNNLTQTQSHPETPTPAPSSKQSQSDRPRRDSVDLALERRGRSISRQLDSATAQSRPSDEHVYNVAQQPRRKELKPARSRSRARLREALVPFDLTIPANLPLGGAVSGGFRELVRRRDGRSGMDFQRTHELDAEGNVRLETSYYEFSAEESTVQLRIPGHVIVCHDKYADGTCVTQVWRKDEGGHGWRVEQKRRTVDGAVETTSWKEVDVVQDNPDAVAKRRRREG